MAENTEEFTLSATIDDQLSKGLQRVGEEGARAGQKIDRGMAPAINRVGEMARQAKRLTNTLKDVAAGFGIAFGIGASAQQVITYITDYIKEVKATEAALTLLDARTRLFGESTAQLAQNIRALAQAQKDAHGTATSQTVGLAAMARITRSMGTTWRPSPIPCSRSASGSKRGPGVMPWPTRSRRSTRRRS